MLLVLQHSLCPAPPLRLRCGLCYGRLCALLTAMVLTRSSYVILRSRGCGGARVGCPKMGACKPTPLSCALAAQPCSVSRGPPMDQLSWPGEGVGWAKWRRMHLPRRSLTPDQCCACDTATGVGEVPHVTSWTCDSSQQIWSSRGFGTCTRRTTWSSHGLCKQIIRNRRQSSGGCSCCSWGSWLEIGSCRSMPRTPWWEP
mmetsp:Transcript_94268/g.224450  ORF Transcript_94268/g.224450 Transcript_94268/m.224450 type:complete len:200 (+) Transcript_94268:1157-1756(+)